MGGKKSNLASRILQWPISRLILLVGAENNVWFPEKEARIIDQHVSRSSEEADEEAMWKKPFWTFEGEKLLLRSKLFVSNLVIFLSFLMKFCFYINLFRV